MRSRTTVLALATLLTLTIHADAVRKRALLIGINDYTATTLKAVSSKAPADRGLDNLGGAVNDVTLMCEILQGPYEFKRSNIATLLDQQATRDAILRELKKLADDTKKDDIVLFFYSGHGSQVRNSLSAEKDRLDESIVPADSRVGARDIRDKELRDAFNRILDRGAKLTVVLDTCHSGSGARGLEGGLRVRQVDPDDDDVKDASKGPRPEDRGALVLSATQDFDRAYEITDPNHISRGALTWALSRALAEAERGEPINDTFQRVVARVSHDSPAQDPVIAGSPDVRLRPFLGERTDWKGRRPVIAIKKVKEDGTYELQGGWANGVTKHSELCVAGNREVRLEVQSVTGISSAIARLTTSPPRAPNQLEPGTLLEISAWAPPPGRPLRVWIPYTDTDIAGFARKLQQTAAERNINWIADPTETTATHLIRWRDNGWEVIAAGRVTRTTTPFDDVKTGHAIFVQLPAPEKLASQISSVEGIELTKGPDNADYILAGRMTAKGLEYSFVRPQVSVNDAARSTLPVRTAWTKPESSYLLEDALMRLQRVHGWHELTSPIGAASYYTLALRRADDGILLESGRLEGERPHYLVLRAKPESASDIRTRFIYAFVIDSEGASTLLFPRPNSGSVENRLPLTRQATKAVRNADTEIPLDEFDPFTVAAPYGTDTYFLLSTDQPLPALGSLEWSGVRGEKRRRTESDATPPEPETPLERLLANTLSGRRSDSTDKTLRTDLEWSLEKVTFYSVPPGKAQP